MRLSSFLLVLVCFFIAVDPLLAGAEQKRYNKLVGKKIVNKAVVVKGEGRVTVVSGVKMLNKTKLPSMLTVECPKKGNKVIVRGLDSRNRGLISSHRNNSSQLSVKCSKRNLNSYMNNIRMDNRGVIK